MIKIYFDTCCYNRPFDDLTQKKIFEEYQSIKNILQKLKDKEIKVYKSDAILYELKRIGDNYKRWKILLFYNSLVGTNIKYDVNIRKRVAELKIHNFKELDSLHIALAEKANVEYFITTDKFLINAYKRANLDIKILNPIEFWEVIENE